MYRLLLFAILLLTAQLGFSQAGPIKILRYFDDFSYLLEQDSIDRKWYEKLKFIPINKQGDFNVSFGGEIREQYQFFQNSNFGDTPPGIELDNNGHLWHRVMLHSDLRLGKDWRIFTQLNSTFAFDKNQITSIDENQLSVHQAFLEWRPTNADGFFMQLGRQEFGQGTLLTIGPREGPNTRLTFDAALFGLEKQKTSVYSFFATPIISEAGVFDDTRIDEYIWTFYVVNKFNKTNLDVYYFGFYSEETQYNFQGGTENRQTLGLRWWKQSRLGLKYSIETMYQFGSFDDLSISAFNFSADIFYRLKTSNKWMPGLTFNYITGDNSPLDESLNTYNSLYSKPSFGLAAPIGPSNIINFRPSLEYNPRPNIKLIASSYLMWRESNQDGTYTPGRNQVRPSPMQLFASDETEIGQQYSFEFWYLYDVNWSFFIDVAYFKAGRYVSETGAGDDIFYLSGKVAFKF